MTFKGGHKILNLFGLITRRKIFSLYTRERHRERGRGTKRERKREGEVGVGRGRKKRNYPK